jgi:hypothetical protein
VAAIAAAVPALEELHLCGNDISGIENAPTSLTGFPQLQVTLRLEHARVVDNSALCTEAKLQQ